MNLQLQRGDVFATSNPHGLGKAICLAEIIKSQDGKAEYGHTGVIQDISGKTIEAVWRIGEQNIFEAYKGNKVLVARWNRQTPAALANGFDAVLPLRHRIYPFHRLLLHMIGVAKWVIISKTPVCSELTAMFLIKAGADLYCGRNYWGVTPDNIVDDWRISKHFDIVFEGNIENKNF